MPPTPISKNSKISNPYFLKSGSNFNLISIRLYKFITFVMSSTVIDYFSHELDCDKSYDITGKETIVQTDGFPNLYKPDQKIQCIYSFSIPADSGQIQFTFDSGNQLVPGKASLKVIQFLFSMKHLQFLYFGFFDIYSYLTDRPLRQMKYQSSQLLFPAEKRLHCYSHRKPALLANGKLQLQLLKSVANICNSQF